ncbi:hypothetical protein AMTRI_Chr12g237680 [Amborella trichopoda]
MAFLASVSMIGILNMASCHVNFPLLETLVERFNYQTNTFFFLPTGETMPTLEEIAKVSDLSLARITYQTSTTTDDHSIMSAWLLGVPTLHMVNGCRTDLYFPLCAVRIHPFSKQSQDSSKFSCSFSPCLLGASGLHHCSGSVGGHLPEPS